MEAGCKQWKWREYMLQGLKLVCIGGGTGLSTLLRGIKQYAQSDDATSKIIDLDQITAIVSVSDDGGSSGRLIDEFGVLPPGDIRNCLVALSDESEVLSELFEHRLTGGEILGGHSIGNLLLIALTQMNDSSFPRAIEDAARVLSVRGNILPATLEATVLCAELMDGEIVQSESRIPKRENRKRIKRVFLAQRINGTQYSDRVEPYECPAHREAVTAIRKADAIVLGPGSLYTSIMPNLVVPDIARSIRESNAVKIYVCNVMSEPGETDHYSVSDHVSALYSHAKSDIDYVLVNKAIAPGDLIQQYVREALLEQFQRIQTHVGEVITRLEGEVDAQIKSLLSLSEQIAQISQDTNRMVDASTVQVLYDPSIDGEIQAKVIQEDLICDIDISERGVQKRVIRHDPLRLAEALSRILHDHDVEATG